MSVMQARRKRFERDTLVIDAKMDVLDTHKKQLAALLASVTAQYDSLSRQRKDLQASLIPFYFLPNELICAIFNLVLDSSPPPPEDALIDAVPLRLSHISTRFRSIALGMPNLWRRIVLQSSDTSKDAPRQITNTYLSRLGQSPQRRIETFYYGDSAEKKENQPSKLLLLIRLPPVTSLTLDAGSSAIHDLASHLSLALINGLRTLKSLTLSMRDASWHELASLDRRLSFHRARENPPVPKDLLSRLAHLKLKDVPLSVVPATDLARLEDVTIEFTCIFDTEHDTSATVQAIPATYTSNHQLARFFRCAPNIKRLALLDAGPFFIKPLNLELNPEEFWSSPNIWREDPTEVPPVPLSALRDLEYTGTFGQALYHFISYFPCSGLEELRLATLDCHGDTGHPIRGPPRLALPSMLPESVDNILTSVTLSFLRTVRIEGTSGDCMKYAFNRLLVPALETLVLENTSFAEPEQCHHKRKPGADTCEICASPYKDLLRIENIFRDPRLVSLRRLELAGLNITSEVAQNWVAYAPVLKELVCDYTQGVLNIILALEPRHAGALLPCPALQRIEVWACEDIVLGDITRRLVEAKKAAHEKPPTAPTMINGRKVKQLKRLGRTDAGANAVAKMQSMKVGACRHFRDKDIQRLVELGVDVDWTPWTADTDET